MRSGMHEDTAIRSASLYPMLPLRPREIAAAIPDLLKEAGRHPANLLSVLGRLSSDQIDILLGKSKLEIEGSHERFRDARWKERGFHRRLALSWLSLDSRLGEWLEMAEMEPVEAKRLDFYLKTILGGISPANFPVTNPEVLDKTLDARGANLLKGLGRCWRDIRENHGLPTQVDKEAFEVGGNLAVTPGKVVLRNRLLELIQYTPRTKTVHKTPTLLVSSFVNRSYIFDLKPGRSTVEYLVSQGHTVFLVSWVNPGIEHRDCGVDEYVQGVIDSVAAARQVSGASSVNLTGLCGGGQMVVLAASVLRARRKRWVNSLTLISYVIDPNPVDTEPGVLCTERAVELAKREVRRAGLYKESSLNWTLNLLQADRLIWNTVVDYYLLGKDPGASEVMYWMNDQVGLPEELFCQQADITLNNPLATAGELEVLGVPIDVGRLKMDSYHLASYYDNVMPWHGMYRNGGLLGGDYEFVVTNGGHITPCITPPGNQKARYFVGSEAGENGQEWLAGAQQLLGSWLAHWQDWLSARSGEKVAAPKHAGSKRYNVLGDAPGTYIFE